MLATWKLCVCDRTRKFLVELIAHCYVAACWQPMIIIDASLTEEDHALDACANASVDQALMFLGARENLAASPVSEQGVFTIHRDSEAKGGSGA